MKLKRSALSQRYVTALKKYLKQGPEASLRPAGGWGRQAVATGLDTLDVVRIHEEALASLEASSSRDGLVKRAEIFFAEAITPIEHTHQVVLKSNVRLGRLSKTLSQRTAELAATNRSLEQGIVHRKSAEEALKKSGDHAKTLLEESHRLQAYLQHLTHQILSAQEDKRKKISHDLQDEIAQTLLAINVRLVTLKREAAVNAALLKKDIALTQRLVEKSAKSIRWFASEFGKTS